MTEKQGKKCPKCDEEMEIGHLRDAPYWRKGTSLLGIGFGPRVFAYKCRNCGYIELYTEEEGVKRQAESKSVLNVEGK